MSCVFHKKIVNKLYFVSFKCGWSTFNNASKSSDFIQRVPEEEFSTKNFQELLLSAHKTIFVRHPQERFVSWFNDKILNRRGDFNFIQNCFIKWGDKNIGSLLDDLYYCNNDKNFDGLPYYIDEFMDSFPCIYHRDGHTRPQVDVYRQHKLQSDDFQKIIHFSKNIEHLKDDSYLEPKIFNRTKSHNLKNNILTKKVINTLDVLYESDSKLYAKIEKT